MNPVANHIRFIVGCITILAGISAICGAWLLWKGFAGGEGLVMTANTAIAGLVGVLSMGRGTPPASPNDPPVPVSVTNPPSNLVPTTDQNK